MKMEPASSSAKVLLLIGALLAATSPLALAQEVYTWTDENGVVHFSDTRPAETPAETIQMDATPGGASYSEPAGETTAPPAATEGEAPLSAAQQRRQKIAEDRQARREEQAATAAMCDRHRKRLEQMEPARRVYYTDENGEQVRMDDIQRVALVEESRNYLAENCQ